MDECFGGRGDAREIVAVRAAAAAALGRFGPKARSALGPLRAFAAREAPTHARREARWALAQILRPQ